MSTYGTLINSFNCFLDSSDTSQKGDDLNLHFGGQQLRCADGQHFKLTLTEFNMSKQTYNIDNLNNAISTIRTVTGASSDRVQATLLSSNNYPTLRDIATEFASKMDALLGGDNAPTVTKPLAEESASASNGLMKLDVTINFANPHLTTNLLIQTSDLVSDSYIILGCDRTEIGSSENSMVVTFPTTTTIRIQGKYPMQLTSMKHMYLRCDLPNTNLQSSSLSNTDHGDHHTVNSNILAKIPMGFTQINYVSPVESEFFLNLSQKTIPSVRLFLTDHRGRSIPKLNAQHALHGPMHFSATIRFDTILRTPPNTLKTPGISRTVPGSKLGPGFVTNKVYLE